MARPILLVIFQSRFSDFHYRLLELEYYKPEFEVVVVDLSMLFLSTYQQSSNIKKSENAEVITPQKWSDLLRLLFNLRRRLIGQPDQLSISIYGATVYCLKSFIYHCLFLLLLKRYFFSVIRLWNGGILIPNLDNIEKHSALRHSIYNRLKKVSSFLELKYYIRAKIFQILARLMPLAHSHILVAGSDWVASLDSSGLVRKNVKIILGHSFDYSAFLTSAYLKRAIVVGDKKSIVYLDTGSPKFLGDSASSGRKVFYTSDKWYPSLCRFFDFIELSRGRPVKIAAHYKAPHKKTPEYFGFREVFFNKTQDLVAEGHEIVSVGSTATSFAVLFKKPIVFLTSDQLNQDKEFISHITEISSLLAMPLINIDQQSSCWDNSLSSVDDGRYDKYVSRCLSSSKLKQPNFIIIKKLTLKSAF